MVPDGRLGNDMAIDPADADPGGGIVELLGRMEEPDRRDRIAIVDDRTAITFGALTERCNRFSAGLVRSGVAPGDRVMLCLLDTLDWPMAFIGTLQAGATPVCADTRLDAAQYEALLRETESRLLIVSRSLYPPFDGLLQRVDTLARVEISEAPLADGGDVAVLLAVDEEAEPPPRPRRAEVCRLSDGARSRAWLDAFAGRTTSHPLPLAGGSVTVEAGDRCLGAGRLCEPAMLEHMLLPALAAGATTILVAEESGPRALRPRLAGERPDALEGHAPTLLFATSGALQDLVRADALRGATPALRAAVVVDGDVDPALADGFVATTGVRIVPAVPLATPPVEPLVDVAAGAAEPARLRKLDGAPAVDPGDAPRIVGLREDPRRQASAGRDDADRGGSSRRAFDGGPDDGPEPGTGEIEPMKTAPRFIMIDALAPDAGDGATRSDAP